MVADPPRSTRTAPRSPYTTLVRAGCRQRIARQADEIALLVEGVPHGPRGRGEDGGMLAHGALDRPSGERKPADSGADSAGPAADSTARRPVRSPDRPG